MLDFQCGHCGRVFNAFTATPLQGIRRSPAQLLLILRGVAQAAPTAQMARELGCDRKHLLELRHRLQDNAVMGLDRNPLGDAVVEADEAYINAGEKRHPAPRRATAGRTEPSPSRIVPGHHRPAAAGYPKDSPTSRARCPDWHSNCNETRASGLSRFASGIGAEVPSPGVWPVPSGEGNPRPGPAPSRCRRHRPTMPHEDRVEGVSRIAVLRANAIGDFIFILPSLEALRAAYPGAEIVLLGRPWHAEFVSRGRPLPVDRAVVVPYSRGVHDPFPGGAENPGELDRFFAAMARERFDLALQLHGGGRNSNPFVLRLGARVTVGLRTPDAPALDRWIRYVYFQPEVFRYLEVVGLVGAEPVGYEPRLAVTGEDLEESRRLVPEGRPLVAVHPGAGDPRRRWPAEKFAAVGDALAAAGARVVVTGTPAERPLVEAVQGAMAAGAVEACGRLSLGGLAGLLARCRVVVSNDSGPLHVAMAVGAATVGIYWCGNLINSGPVTRARHRPALSWRLDCPLCGRNCLHDDCGHKVSFVADVPVEEIRESALDVLARSEPATGRRSPGSVPSF